jgi:hypothetical protein
MKNNLYISYIFYIWMFTALKMQKYLPRPAKAKGRGAQLAKMRRNGGRITTGILLLRVK